MEPLIALTQWLITAIGFVTVGIVVLRSMSKEDSPLVSLLTPIQSFLMKAAGITVIGFVILVQYQLTDGILSIKNIGMYVACFGILYSLLKDMAVKSSVFSDIQAVITHKASKLQSSLAEQAEEARRANSSKKE